MSILDDAIREHLELKRAHGADEAELKKLEDEAFGPPGRPDAADPLAEAPTEFLGAPAIHAREAADEAHGDAGERRPPNITDLQEPPPPLPSETAEELVSDEAADVDDGPAEEQQPAMEHQTIPVPHPEPARPSESEPELGPADEADHGPSTEERHAIADQPTEFFDVEAELDAGAEQRSPTDEQLLDSQLAEPRLAPVEPLDSIPDTGPDAEVAHPPAFDEEEDEDDFFSEQRLSDELDQALEAPVTDEHEALPQAPLPTDEHEAFAPPTPTDEHEALPPPPPREEETAVYNVEGASDESEDEDPYEPETGSHEDVLEDTPEFLEDAPEDDELWFEQRPPKDFDFDD